MHPYTVFHAGNCITTVREADTCDFNSTVIDCGPTDPQGAIEFRSLECLCPRSSTDTRCRLTSKIFTEAGP